MPKLLLVLLAAIILFTSILLLINLCSSSSNSFLIVDSSQAYNPQNQAAMNSKQNILISDIRFKDLLIGIKSILNPNETKCIYPEYEFTQEEIKEIWNYEDFNDCQQDKIDNIVIENDKFEVNCLSGYQPEFLSFPNRPERLGGGIKFAEKWNSYSPDLKEVSFAFVRCGMNRTYNFVFNRFDFEIQERSKLREKEILKSMKGKNDTLKRFNVLLLTFDSVSRGSAYRNLKRVTSYLNEKLDYASVFEFTNPAIPEIHTLDNMAQILYGKSKKKMESILGQDRLPIYSKIHIDYQKNSIWSHYKNMGYVTLFLHDTVWNSMNYLTGYEILADIVFANYWKAVWSVYGFHDYSSGQRCIGSVNSHNVSLNYTHNFFKNFPKNHKFAYVHLNTAHEFKGNIKTLDKDLLYFIKSITQYFHNTQQDFVIFLIGDHGQRNNKIQFDIRNSIEPKQPMTFIITSKLFTDNNTNSILSYNSKQMFSRFDINLSLKELSYYPYGGIKEKNYKAFKGSYEAKDVVSLFKENISYYRKCQDIDISNEMCPCSFFNNCEKDEHDMNVYNEVLLPMIIQIMKDVAKEKENCSLDISIVLKELQKLILLGIDDGWETIYIVEITDSINHMQNAFYYIRGCTEKRIQTTNNILDGKINIYRYFDHYRSRMFYQLFDIKTLNNCEKSCFC